MEEVLEMCWENCVYYLLGPEFLDYKMKQDMPWGLMYDINIL